MFEFSVFENVFQTRFSKTFQTFETPITLKRLKISIWNSVHQWSNHNPVIKTIFMTINARFVILWDFEFFAKRTR